MPISKDEFRSIDKDGPSLPDLAPDTTQGTVYRFLLDHAGQAFGQQEIVDALNIPERNVGPTLKRLDEYDLVGHRDRFWTIADAECAVASAGLHSASMAEERDGGFSNDDVERWMETAVDPIESTTDHADEGS